MLALDQVRGVRKSKQAILSSKIEFLAFSCVRERSIIVELRGLQLGLQIAIFVFYIPSAFSEIKIISKSQQVRSEYYFEVEGF